MATLQTGPLPPADELILYEKACAGAADRIITMAENEQKHDHEARWYIIKTTEEQNKKIVDADSRNSFLGVIFGFLISVAAIGGGVYTAFIGQPIPASFIGVSGVAGLATAFISGTRMRNKDNNEN
jgi:uncharacterized membrane protein